MLKQAGSISVILADKAEQLARTPKPTCEIVITDVEYEIYASRVVKLKISGIAWGVAKVNVILLRIVRMPQVQARVRNKTWTTTFDFTEHPQPYGTPISVIVKSVEPTSCQATAHANFKLGIDTLSIDWEAGSAIQQPAGCLMGFQSEWNQFVGGNVDRFVPMRYFVPFTFSFGRWTVADKQMLKRLVLSTGVSSKEAIEWVEGMSKRAATAIDKIIKQADAKKKIVNMYEIYAALAKAEKDQPLLPSIPTTKGQSLQTGNPNEEQTSTNKNKTSEFRIPLYETQSVSGARFVYPLPFMSDKKVEKAAILDSMKSQGIIAIGTTPSGLNYGVAPGAATHWTPLGWLGVLFFDRLRMRPAGIIAGEHVYSLSLAPGEETTITQKSTTKRTKSFEEVLTREQEQELEFSSTWSTDLSQGTTDTKTSTTTQNLGMDIGVNIGNIVNVGGNAGSNASQSHSISQTGQRTRSRSFTSKAATKLRSEHKTTFKVGTEVIEEYGSRRVLRNPNPSRAMTLNFFKLYQKYRVILERYDARLCLRVFLWDPGFDLRWELEQELAKFNPVLPPGACPVANPGTWSESARILSNYDWYYDWGKKKFDYIIPAGMQLQNYEFKLTKWVIYNADTDQLQDADVSYFSAYGGYILYNNDVPEAGSTGPVSIQVQLGNWGYSNWYTVYWEGTMIWRYVPTAEYEQEVQACVEKKLQEIRDSFSTERVSSILEEVSAWERQLIERQLIDRVLLPGIIMSGGAGPKLIDRMRNFFEWEEMYIEYIPWQWAAHSRKCREELIQRLLKLPGDTRSDWLIHDFLVASYAFVYLPIKRDKELELEALQCLTNYDIGGYQAIYEGVVDDFDTWCDDAFKEISHQLSSSEDVMTKEPELGTPAGSGTYIHDWEKPRQKIVVLDEWAESVPTDGVHIEPSLSQCGGIDEFRAQALVSDIELAAKQRKYLDASAKAAEKVAEREDVKATINLGDLKD